MIQWVCNVNLSLASHVARASVPRRIPAPPAGARVAYLGITDEGRSSPFESAEEPKLCLQFDDWDPDAWSEPLYASGPTPPRAERIAVFVRELHARPEPVALWIHCHKGVARSGAVAQWVHETMGAEWACAPRVGMATAVPNKTLLRMLRETQ